MERFALEQLIDDIARQAAREAVAESGNALSRRQQIDGYWGNVHGGGDDGGGAGGGDGFPQRRCDPFYWMWNQDTQKVTIGNIVFYLVDGTWVFHGDVDLSMSPGTTYVYLTFAHPTDAITIATTGDYADTVTTEADRNDGNQKLLLYEFKLTDGVLECKLDRIHHCAVATNFW